MSSCCPTSIAVSSIYQQNARRVVFAKNDYQVQRMDDQVQVIGNDTGNPTVRLCLPDNPIPGQRQTLIAVTDPITVDGGNNAVLSSATTIPVGFARTFYFAKPDPCACDGVWVPDQVSA